MAQSLSVSASEYVTTAPSRGLSYRVSFLRELTRIGRPDGRRLLVHIRLRSQTAERIRAAEQERLAAEVRSAHRQQQQLAARLRRHQVKLTASKPAELAEVASWAPPQPRSSSGS